MSRRPGCRTRHAATLSIRAMYNYIPCARDKREGPRCSCSSFTKVLGEAMCPRRQPLPVQTLCQPQPAFSVPEREVQKRAQAQEPVATLPALFLFARAQRIEAL